MMKWNQTAWLAAGGLAAAFFLSPAHAAAQSLNRSPGSPPAAPAAAAPAPHESMPVSLHLEGTPLRTALQMLFAGSGLQYAVEPAVPEYPITLNIHDIPLNTALRTLLRLAPGVTFRKEGDIYIVGMRAPTPAPTANETEPPAPVETAADVGGQRVERIPLNYIHPAILAYVLNGQLVPTEVQIQPGLGSYGGGFNGPAGSGAYGSQNGGGLGPSGYPSLGNGSLNGFAPGYGSNGGMNGNPGGLGQGLGSNVFFNPMGNSVVVAPQARRY